MEKSNFIRSEKSWNLYHIIEDRQKRRILKRLSVARSFQTLSELYKLSYSINPDIRFNILDMDKLKALASIHRIFGKIK